MHAHARVIVLSLLSVALISLGGCNKATTRGFASGFDYTPTDSYDARMRALEEKQEELIQQRKHDQMDRETQTLIDSNNRMMYGQRLRP